MKKGRKGRKSGKRAKKVQGKKRDKPVLSPLPSLGNVTDALALKTEITWYTGKDLLDPFCDAQSAWTPTDDSLVMAATEKWSARPPCGSFHRLTAPQNGNSIVVRMVDLCAGCAPGIPHADLTQRAFKALYGDLNIGLVDGVLIERIAAPSWPWSESDFGPQLL